MAGVERGGVDYAIPPRSGWLILGCLVFAGAALLELDPGLANWQFNIGIAPDGNAHKIPGQQRADDKIPGGQCTGQLTADQFLEVKTNESQQQGEKKQSQGGVVFH